MKFVILASQIGRTWNLERDKAIQLYHQNMKTSCMAYFICEKYQTKQQLTITNAHNKASSNTKLTKQITKNNTFCCKKASLSISLAEMEVGANTINGKEEKQNFKESFD